MARRRTVGELRIPVLLGAVAAVVCLFPSRASGQTDRITRPIEDSLRVRQRGSQHRLARAEFDAGRVDPESRMERMVLVLRPDASQEQGLEALLEAQQDTTSPQYHQWLTPEDFGGRFGISDHDLNQVIRWLQAQGFEVEPVADSRRQIIFSGTARQVESAFRTEIHAYWVRGTLHHANASEVEIPAALAAVVDGVLSLHDFHSRPMHAGMRPAETDPQYTVSSTVHYVVPGDFSTIYNLGPLYGSSTNGSGQSIAIVARSNLKMSDVEMFRTKFSLPANDPQVIVNGSDPGVLSSDEQGEVELDAEWSGAVAPNASIQVVVSASTQTTDGINLSAQYIVNHNLAPVASVSFGNCESGMSRTENQFWNGLWQQAAAQGMSVFVASGDSGAAGCDAPTASSGHSADVNGLCSSPYVTCVGGTQFDDTSNPAAYWYATNSGNGASALGYIPEIAWNESGSNGGSGLWSSGGGPSSVYAKPSWQSGPGVPRDSHRDVPDVALASASHDGYLFFLNGSSYSGSGTSVAAPSFAGIMALLDGRLGTRQGNANPSLYTLAGTKPRVFHDITSGNNSVPGVAGFTAGSGYDLVTGLGSVDANLLVNSWPGGAAPPPPPPPCSYSLSGAGAATDASAQSLTVTLTASAGDCMWTASSDSGWLVITSGGSGPGSQTVVLSVAANPSSLPRAGTLTIAGLAFAVTQAGTPCTYTVTAGAMSRTADGFNGWIGVTTPEGCTWTAASSASWITITSGATGSGGGGVRYVTAANTGGTRQGTISVAGYAVLITQGPRGKLGVAHSAAPNGMMQ